MAQLVRFTSVDFRVNEAGLAGQVSPILRRTHSSLTRQIANQARINVPVLTGNLGRSIREDPQVFQGPFRVTGGVTAHANYAAPVHEGSRPHIIRARHAQFLHFFWRGREVFVKSVRHPGTRSRPFLRNAAHTVIARDPRVH